MPIVVIAALLLLSAVISWLSYYHLTAVTFWKKWVLIALRTASLAILVLLLLNPFRTAQIEETNPPIIAIYLDNTQSTGVERGDYEGLTSFQSVIDELNSSKPGNVEYQYFLFSDEVEQGTDVQALGTSTNLHNVMDHISQNENDFRASIVVSDGIFTQGRNPVFAAQRLSNPLITIPVGDTSTVKDVLIADVEYNQTAYTNTLHHFTADIQQMGFENEETAVQFLIDGEITDSETVSFSTSGSRLVEFTHEFTEPGFYNLEVNVPVKQDEYTDRNNTASFTIEAIDDKTHILSLAFEIHPDVRAIRELAATDQQNELVSSTYLQDNIFIGDDPRSLDQEFDLVILHGLPDPGSDILQWLNNLRLPVVYIATPASSEHAFSSDYGELISLSTEETEILLDVHPELNQDSGSHPILETDPVIMTRFPTLKAYRGNYSTSALSETLIRGQFQRNSTDIPLLLAEDTQVRRLVTVNAFGWYRYTQSRNEEAVSFFENLFTNIIGWASTPPDRRTLRIEPVKPVFSENETIEIRANLLNERGEPESEGIIELYFFEGENDEQRVFRMNHIERGSYRAETGSYPEGVYRVEAVAEKNNREIGLAETRVRVSQSSAELINTKRNDELLERISEVTGGLFLQDKQFGDINRFISDHNLNEASDNISTEFIYTFETGWWFFVVILLLSFEWMLRRTISLP